MEALGSSEGLALLSLLVAGHCLGDFVFQTKKMAEGKRQAIRPLLHHGCELLIVQAVVLVPFFLDRGVGFLACVYVAIAHVLVDRGKVVIEQRFGRDLRWFAIDQVLHLAVLASAVVLWAAFFGPPLAGPIVVSEELLLDVGAVVAAYSFAGRGGSAIVAGLLGNLREEQAESEPRVDPSAGRMIGILERLLMVTLVWQGEWGAVGFVLAAKSVARFKELDDRRFAETYLVGTLTSVLVAGALGIGLRLLIV